MRPVAIEFEKVVTLHRGPGSFIFEASPRHGLPNMNALTLFPSQNTATLRRVADAVRLLRSFDVEASSLTDAHGLWAVASSVVEQAPVAAVATRRWVRAPALPVEMLERLNLAVEQVLTDGMHDAAELIRPCRLAVFAVALLADPDCRPLLSAAIAQALLADGNFLRLPVQIGLPRFSAEDVAIANHDAMVDVARKRDPRDMVSLANAEYHRRKAQAARGSRIVGAIDVERRIDHAKAELRRDAAAVLDQIRLAA